MLGVPDTFYLHRLLNNLEIKVNFDIRQVKELFKIPLHDPIFRRHIQRRVTRLGLTYLDIVSNVKRLVVTAKDQRSKGDLLAVLILNEVFAAAFPDRELFHHAAGSPDHPVIVCINELYRRKQLISIFIYSLQNTLKTLIYECKQSM